MFAPKYTVNCIFVPMLSTTGFLVLKKMFVICFDRECSQMEIYISSLQTGIRMARGYVQCSKGYMGLDSFVRINFQINFLKEEKA